MTMFSEEIIEQVWSKAVIVSNNDPNVWRKDYAGAWIRRDHYGNKESEYGWEIDHIKPVSVGGGNELANLLPLQWQNNQTKENQFPEWKTNKTAVGIHNGEKEQSWKWQE